MTEVPYTTATVPAPPELRAQLEGLTGQHAGAARGGLRQMALVVVAVFGAIALLDLAFGIIETAHWVVLVLGSAILLVPMLLIHRRSSAPEADALIDDLRADLASGLVLRHTLLRDERHAFVPHEHGVIHLCPADPARTLFLDLSSVTGDPRHDQWYAEGLIDRARWTWFSTTSGAVQLGFEADGAPVPRRVIDAADETALFEALGSPTDGDVIARPWAEMEAFLRAGA
ncbi:hypothetical protein [Roseomonas sp. CECT 9278]|uniref:hypothetical protein n=1 Tax=Roseomonas sp. CECT 9278 TaxID=2845823 RepID=UPI001E62EC4D|nr:hypothetical protein [Roseomonas sp. CECT 9278]